MARLPPSRSSSELPLLWDKPDPKILLTSLQALRVEAPVWNAGASQADITEQQAAWVAAHDRREVVAYLSHVVKSSLSWVDDEDDREHIWTEASRRLTERCGRAAMGEIVRRWPFDMAGQGDSFHLVIREPALTGHDAMGLKTWGSSYALASLLPQASSGPLMPHLLSAVHQGGKKKKGGPARILELGSGTGLLGLAAACFWRAEIVLTDLPIILPNLAHNVELNRGVLEDHGGRAEVAALTWGGGPETESSSAQFNELHHYQLILAADTLYDDNHPALLPSTIDAQLGLGAEARALVMVPLRDETTHRLLASFRAEMGRQGRPLVCVHESTVAGQDDWGEGDGSDGLLKFWWAVFGRL